MFPLKQRKTIGYGYGDRTFYSAHHLGQDYRANVGTKLYAPFKGKIISEINGKQGGMTIWFQAEGSTDIMRFMHLSKFVAKIGKVKEGDVIALTGNTGSATTGAHLHIDISKKKVIISDWTNFKDPEKYKWDVETTQKIDFPVPKVNETTQVPTLEPIVQPDAISGQIEPVVEVNMPQQDTNIRINELVIPEQAPIIEQPKEITGISEVVDLFKLIYNFIFKKHD